MGVRESPRPTKNPHTTALNMISGISKARICRYSVPSTRTISLSAGAAKAMSWAKIQGRAKTESESQAIRFRLRQTEVPILGLSCSPKARPTKTTALLAVPRKSMSTAKNMTLASPTAASASVPNRETKKVSTTPSSVWDKFCSTRGAASAATCQVRLALALEIVSDAIVHRKDSLCPQARDDKNRRHAKRRAGQQ